VDRANQRAAALIDEGTTDLLDETDQRCVRHERTGPEPLVQFGLRDHARRGFDQEGKKVECLWREVDILARLLEPTCVRVEAI